MKLSMEITICIIVVLIFSAGVLMGYWFHAKRNEDAPIEEMRSLIAYGADAYTAWLDDEAGGVYDVNQPFGVRSGWMLQALSRMNNFSHRENLDPAKSLWHTYAYTYGGEDSGKLYIDGIEKKESVIFWARLSLQLSLKEALIYTEGGR